MSSETAALTVIEGSKTHPGQLMRQATDVAGVCGEIVKRTAQNIQGRKYVKVEGWQSIAVAYGCVASSKDVEKVEGGIKAVGEVRRMSDGVLIATAEGFVGDDEKTWQSRPEYARRAMAQTRAISRACRSAFAFVVTMIDNTLSTTPAEEMDGLDAPSQQTINAPQASRPAPRPAPKPSTGGATFPGYGSMSGKPLSEGSDKDLAWYAGNCRKSIADPAKAKWIDKERATLAAIEAEQARRGGSQSSDEPPPHTDEEAPF